MRESLRIKTLVEAAVVGGGRRMEVGKAGLRRRLSSLSGTGGWSGSRTNRIKANRCKKKEKNRKRPNANEQMFGGIFEPETAVKKVSEPVERVHVLGLYI